jgi:hypothetical protein
MNRAIHLTAIVGLLAFLLLIIGTSGTYASPFITDCTVITQPGSYILTNNITATQNNVKPIGPGAAAAACILITADSVTLDLGGFAITATNLNPNVEVEGISTNFNGSQLADHYGIYVHSGTVANFSSAGVNLHGHGLTVEHIRAVKNQQGIVVNSINGTPNGNRIADNTLIFNSLVGISVACPSVVVGNVAAGNGTGTAGAQIVEGDAGILGNGPCTNAENSPNIP